MEHSKLKVVAALVVVLFQLIEMNLATSGSAAQSADRPPVNITVVSEDGKLLVNVPVVGVGPATNAVLTGSSIAGGTWRQTTDSAGRVCLPYSESDMLLVVATEKAVALAHSRDLTNGSSIIAQPWGRIEGIRSNRGRPLAGARLSWDINWRCVGLELSSRLTTGEQVLTDSQGRFLMQYVPPTEVRIMEAHEPPSLSICLQYLRVKPGGVSPIDLATQGLTVTGHLALSEGLLDMVLDPECFSGGFGTEMKGQRFVLPEIPQDYDTAEKRILWWHEFWFNTDAGRQMTEVGIRGRFFALRPDGSLFTEMVEPGRYTVWGNIQQNGKRLAKVREFTVTIPEGPAEGDAAFDIGTIRLEPAVNLRKGDIAPDFQVKTLDGLPLKLSDFKGKYVLLDFWATWCGPCVAELPNLKTINESFGKDGRLVLIGLSLDSDPRKVEQFVRARGFSWSQICLGDFSTNPVTSRYGVYAIPRTILVNPDGTIGAIGLRGTKLREAIELSLTR